MGGIRAVGNGDCISVIPAYPDTEDTGREEQRYHAGRMGAGKSRGKDPSKNAEMNEKNWAREIVQIKYLKYQCKR